MILQEKIREDLKCAINDFNFFSKNFLRVVVGEMDRVGKDLPDEKVLPILKKMKQNAIEMGNKDEIELLSRYLPQELPTEDVEAIVSEIIISNSYTQPNEIGKFMKDISTHEKSSVINKKTAKDIFFGQIEK